MDDKLFIKLRDCFTAGYTLPQYCIDNEIKKPLFVVEISFESFIKEVQNQFKCDKRLLAQFCFVDNEKEFINIPMWESPMISTTVKLMNISKVNLNNFDAIILLTKKNYDIKFKRIFRFDDFENVFIRRTYVDIPLLHFLQRHPKVKLFLTNFPDRIIRYEGGKEFDSTLADYGELKKTLAKSVDKGINVITPFDKFGYNNSQVISLLKDAITITHPDGSTTMLDDDDPLVRIQKGKRTTAYQPEKFLNRIFICGTCHWYGTNTSFDKTIASYLQKMLNENNLPYRVENEGQCYWGRYQDIFYNLNKLSPMPNDIIFIAIMGMRSTSNNIPFFDVSNAFDSPHDYREIFCRKGHVNELGYKLVAEKYFAFLTENNFFRDKEFNYPLPPPIIITDTAYRLGSSRAA